MGEKTFKTNRCLVGPNLRFFEVPESLKIYFKDVPIYFLIFFEVFGIRKVTNTGSTGPEMTINMSKN